MRGVLECLLNFKFGDMEKIGSILLVINLGRGRFNGRDDLNRIRSIFIHGDHGFSIVDVALGGSAKNFVDVATVSV